MMNSTSSNINRNPVRPLLLLTILICLAVSTTQAEEQLSALGKANQLLHQGINNENIDIVRSALEQGAEPDSAPDSKYSIESKTALISAVRSGNTAIVNLLLDQGATIDKKSSMGSTNPLCAAIKMGDIQLIKLLLKRGADLNKNIGFMNNWRRPLHFAARNGKMELVQLLLDEGAVIMPNRTEASRPRFFKMFDDYASLLKYAEQGKNKELYKLLEEKGAL